MVLSGHFKTGIALDLVPRTGFSISLRFDAHEPRTQMQFLNRLAFRISECGPGERPNAGMRDGILTHFQADQLNPRTAVR